MKPMMADREVEIITQIIDSLIPRQHRDTDPDIIHCLEWGSGGSTIHFPAIFYMNVNWLSIEHDGHWVQKISKDLPDNANVIWAPDNEWYVDCVKHSRIFDFILIDGLHRERCLEIARKIVSEDGVILLHDSGRKEYQDFIKKNDGEILIEGEEPHEGYFKHRGLALFRRQRGT